MKSVKRVFNFTGASTKMPVATNGLSVGITKRKSKSELADAEPPLDAIIKLDKTPEGLTWVRSIPIPWKPKEKPKDPKGPKKKNKSVGF